MRTWTYTWFSNTMTPRAAAAPEPWWISTAGEHWTSDIWIATRGIRSVALRRCVLHRRRVLLWRWSILLRVLIEQWRLAPRRHRFAKHFTWRIIPSHLRVFRRQTAFLCVECGPS